MKAFIETVRAIAAEDPDFNYRKQEGYNETKPCSYLGNTPGSFEGKGCIIGEALKRSGVDMNAVHEEYESDGVSAGVGALLSEHPEWFGTTKEQVLAAHHRRDMDARFDYEWLCDVQRSQDCDLPWGEAVEVADTERADREAELTC